MQFEKAYIDFKSGVWKEDASGEYHDVEIEDSGWVRATKTSPSSRVERHFSPSVIERITEMH